MPKDLYRIRVIDSHTGGEPTRVVTAGGPGLGRGPLAERRKIFAEKYDAYRSAIVNEPRGSELTVGALLTAPTDPTCVSGVIFFNNVGYLGMCGHGTIGLAVTLGHMGRITAGSYKLETPVGVVTFDYDGENAVTLENVPSYRFAKDVSVDVPDYGTVIGDVAWGGNWFFLVNNSQERIAADNTDRLIDVGWRIRKALEDNHIAGKDGALIDHVELFGPAANPENDSRNFVLCPGKAYDRSPCGTGTSAKLACLYESGKLKKGQTWRQESVIGSVFEGSVRIDDAGQIIPRIRGTAFINAEATLLLDPKDPFKVGLST